MLSRDELLVQLNCRGILRENGHFALHSGYHSPAYFDKGVILHDPCLASEAAHLMAVDVMNRIGGREVVILGPPTSGTVFACYVAAAWASLAHGYGCHFAYGEKGPEGTIVFSDQNQACLYGADVVVIEDVLTMGSSVRRLIGHLQHLGSKVIAVGAICNRGGVTAESLGAPSLCSLFDVPLQIYEARECPQSVLGVPIDLTFGHGRQFVKRHRGKLDIP